MRLTGTHDPVKRAGIPFDTSMAFSYPSSMRITLLPQGKEIEIPGRRRAADVLRQLGILPGTALVIRRRELVPEHEMLEADDCVEVRFVISGGA